MFQCIPNFQQKLRPQPRTFLGLIAVLVLTCVYGHAQATQGAIIGSVKDAAGAVIPNATVTLTNTDEGTLRSLKSNSVGDFRAERVAPRPLGSGPNHESGCRRELDDVHAGHDHRRG